MLGLITSLARYFILLGLTFVVATLLVPFIKPLYITFFGYGGGFDIDFTDVAIFAMTYKLVVPLSFVLLGDRWRYIATIIFVTPILVFEVIFDPQFLQYSIIPMGTGLIIAVILRLIASNTLGKMPSLEPMKRYF